jgi:hypothetical protein
MVPSLSESEFRRFLGSRSVDVETAALADVITAVLDFYGSEPATGLKTTPQADMLLFQFGVYDWGRGENFEFDITRQFILEGEEGDDAISQLHCTVAYAPTMQLRSVGNGNRWCQSGDDLTAFKTFILASDAFMAAQHHPSKHTHIAWEQV